MSSLHNKLAVGGGAFTTQSFSWVTYLKCQGHISTSDWELWRSRLLGVGCRRTHPMA